MSSEEKMNKENLEINEKENEEKNQELEVKNLNSEHKPRKPKRNPKEKIVDDSIETIDKCLNQEKNQLTPKKLKKISDNLKKEINKNLEVEMMINVKKDIENLFENFSAFEEKDKLDKFLKMKEDFLMIKKHIEEKKLGLKRKCALDDDETPAKKLKNNINLNDTPEKEEEKEILIKKETLKNKDPKDIESEQLPVIQESPDKDNDNIIEESIKMSSNNIKINNNTNTNNKKDSKQLQKNTIINYFNKSAVVKSKNQSNKISNDNNLDIKNSETNNITDRSPCEITPFNKNPEIEITKYIQLPANHKLSLYDSKKIFLNYIKKVSKIIKNSLSKDNKKKRRYIYFQGSYVSKINLEKKSDKIKPRNPLRKDEFLIDYDKDSDEEEAEENGEDLKSNDGDEEEEEKEDDEEDQNKWIVPDGYLSENELLLSDREEYENEDRINNVEHSGKGKNIFEIMDIRKTYQKPIIINFKSVDQDIKVKNLSQFVKARVYNNGSSKLSFPIKIVTKSQLINANNSFNLDQILIDKIERIIELIHGNYNAKENLINIIIDEIPELKKSRVKDFINRFTEKLKNDQNERKRWIVKKEIIDFYQIPDQKLKNIIEYNDKNLESKINKDKEEKMKKRRETLIECAGNNILCQSQQLEKDTLDKHIPVTEIKQKKKSLNQSNENPKIKKRPSSKKSKSKIKEEISKLCLKFQSNVSRDDSTFNK